MTLAQAWGVAPAGLGGVMVKVEVDVSQGLPSIGMVGLAQTSVTEARWRVRSAVINSGLSWPGSRITIGLSPADLPKTGTSLDLPIAVGILLATEQLQADDPMLAFIGELGLDGCVRPVPGALASAISAAGSGHRSVVVCAGNARAVSEVPGLRVIVVRDLAHLVAVLRGESEQEPVPAAPVVDRPAEAPDFSEVHGHERARLGLEVAAAGGHHLSLIGPPGVGKTMLASRLPGILPPLDPELAMEVTAVHSLAGAREPEAGLMSAPPFIAPHHSISVGAMLGAMRGGRLIPGAVTLAHGGVLFLDEAPEFARPCLEGLRQPLEQGSLSLMRVERGLQVPARFQLVLAANPCPCGHGVERGELCRCTPMAKRRYAERLSGPLMDRVDIRCVITRPATPTPRAVAGESSSVIAARVLEARARASARFAECPWSTNAQLPAKALHQRYAPEDRALGLIAEAERRGLGPRGRDRVLRLSWTLADLAGLARPGREQVSLALALRNEEPSA